MKKSFRTAIIIMLIGAVTIACQSDDTPPNKTNTALDTSKLIKVENEDLSFPFDTYKASSLETALEAIPFSVTLPEDLPFEAAPFKVMNIYDWEKDGKKVGIELLAVSKDSQSGKSLFISASNLEPDIHGENKKTEEADITNRTTGTFTAGDSNLKFSADGIFYSITLIDDTLSEHKLKEALINIAKQILS